MSHLLKALSEVGVDSLDQLVQGSLVLLVHSGKGQGGGSLLANNGTKTSLALQQGRAAYEYAMQCATTTTTTTVTVTTTSTAAN